MKFSLLFCNLLLLSCSAPRHWTGRESTVSDAAFSREQAERILGVEVDEEEIGRTYGCVVHDKYWHFTSEDKRGTVLAIVDFNGTDSAGVALRYASAVRKLGMKDSNRVSGVGDEAHLRAGPHQFWLSARKGLYTIDFSIKPTSTSTAAEFVRVAGEVVDRLNRD